MKNSTVLMLVMFMVGMTVDCFGGSTISVGGDPSKIFSSIPILKELWVYITTGYTFIVLGMALIGGILTVMMILMQNPQAAAFCVGATICSCLVTTVIVQIFNNHGPMKIGM